MKKMIGWLAILAPLVFLATGDQGLQQIAQAFAWITLAVMLFVTVVALAACDDEDMEEARVNAAKRRPFQQAVAIPCHVAIIALFAYHGMVITAIAWAAQWALIRFAIYALRQEHEKRARAGSL